MNSQIIICECLNPWYIHPSPISPKSHQLLQLDRKHTDKILHVFMLKVIHKTVPEYLLSTLSAYQACLHKLAVCHQRCLCLWRQLQFCLLQLPYKLHQPNLTTSSLQLTGRFCAALLELLLCTVLTFSKETVIIKKNLLAQA